jgi:hypothetical protein
MKCTKCGEEMRPGYVMVPVGSVAGWYDQEERKRAITSGFGGEMLLEPGMLKALYAEAYRCGNYRLVTFKY